ncbi:zonular occludens toxin family protein [Rhodoferax ferrireducens]|uniref:zonular occludens toxin family protein n=1 Tax=Rhodoferax ferrireducens TaxID=192843 RepID=UPI000E0DE2FD|nr:zonular occludens toxin domain-containing protein [Rhodoferax ferrireducens]
MITLITGAPGTGKSAALVDLLSKLSKTRTVYASGIPGLQIEHQVLVDPATWPDTVPDGSIIVIDEVQRVWRPRGPGSKVPPDISMLETHRHRGLDFYVVTQAPRLVDSNIRGLVGRHVHLRDLGIIGRFWYEWPECADNCATGWKNAPIKKRYRLPKAIFSQYKSASEHIKPIRSFPWMLVVMALALLTVAVMSWRSYVAISGKLHPASSVPVQASPKTLDGIVNRPVVSGESLPVYDTSAFVPRISSKPESAPLYDHLRVVVNMPMVAGALCMGEKCKCVTQQGTDAGLSPAECSAWLKNVPFNPYQGLVREAGASAGPAWAVARPEPPALPHSVIPDSKPDVVPLEASAPSPDASVLSFMHKVKAVSY